MTAQAIIRKLETGLTPLGAFRARPMFGGHGLYLDDLMFGLIYNARLYLKSDEESLPAFERAGSEPFVYDSAKGSVSTSYWLCPPAALKDATKLRAWVARAHAAAQRVKLKRKLGAKRKPAAKRRKI